MSFIVTARCVLRTEVRRSLQERASVRSVIAAACVLVLYAALPAHAETDAPTADVAPPSVSPATTVDVVSVTSLATATPETQRQCWPSLVTERQFLVDQSNARPWALRHVKQLTGVLPGVAAGAYFAAQSLAPVWMLPAALVGGMAGWVIGPLGVVLGAGGGLLGHALTHQVPVAIAGGLAGAAIGMALWPLLMPPPKPATPSSVVEIPLQIFVTRQECEETRHVHTDALALYRVSYYFDGELRSADLSYDPGDTVQIGADGKPTAPAQGD